MLIQEMMDIVKKYFKSGSAGIYNSEPSDTPMGEEIGLYEYSGDDRSFKYCVCSSLNMDRGSYCKSTDHFKHEGDAVYSLFMHLTHSKDFHADFELMYYDKWGSYEDMYGVTIKVDDEWRVYLADSHMFVLARQDFTSAREAMEYFKETVKDDPYIQKLIKDYVSDYEAV
ncbi:MAG: hypothetical protein IK018_07910 [Lachnospiraceae bacterium]|nr:hypothetical protein [Lachnospiraceae bacterium]MBR5993716.1 hypothetical protein [Lachnospiraceae bacterium]